MTPRSETSRKLTAAAAKIFRVHWLPSAFLLVVSLTSYGLALTFLADPAIYLDVSSFQGTFRLMDPWLWSLLLSTLATWIVTAVSLNRRNAIVPAQGLALLFIIFGLSVLPTVGAGGGVPSAVIMYSAMGLVSSLSGVLAWAWDDLHRAAEKVPT